jgi:hypothetical protein
MDQSEVELGVVTMIMAIAICCDWVHCFSSRSAMSTRVTGSAIVPSRGLRALDDVHVAIWGKICFGSELLQEVFLGEDGDVHIPGVGSKEVD